jgi:hypothetical protein
LEGQPFIVVGQWQLERWSDGVVGGDGDLVDERFAHGFAGVGCAVGEDVMDVIADLGLIGEGEGLRRLVEFELQLGFGGAQLFGLGLEGGQAVTDVGVFVVEGALLERDQVPVDRGAGVLELAGEGGEFVALAGAVGGVAGLIGYGPLARRVDTRPDFLSQPLDQVSRRASEVGEPLWSALVVSRDGGKPNAGFYGMARRMRPEYADLTDDQVWERERDRCYAAAS